MNNSTIRHMPQVIETARRLDCEVVAVLENFIMCRRVRDNTYITWRVAVMADVPAVFSSGDYDMTADAAQSNLIDRAWDIHL